MSTATAEVIDLDVEKQWREAKAVYEEYRSKTVEFGRIMAGLRTQYQPGAWAAEVKRRGYNLSHVSHAIHAHNDPAWFADRNAKRNAGKRAARSAESQLGAGTQVSDVQPAPQRKDNQQRRSKKKELVIDDKAPPNPLAGELHEAFRGLKAAIHYLLRCSWVTPLEVVGL